MKPCDGVGWVNGWPVLCTDDNPCAECEAAERLAARTRHPSARAGCPECGPWCPTGCPPPDAPRITDQPAPTPGDTP